MNQKHILPSLVLIFSVLVLSILIAQPISSMVSASKSTIPSELGQGQGIAIGESDPTNPPDTPAPTNGDGEEDDENGDTTAAQQNQATSEQTGGISAGDIIQRSNTQLTEQYCKTIAGIGDRRCQQQAPTGAVQDCEAIAGLGQAACLQSENPDGTGTCLTANGRPFICESSTGKAISGSGQAGLGGGN